VAAVLGGAALAAFAEAVGRGPVEPELARAEAVGLVRERSELTGWLPHGRMTAGGSGRLLPGTDGWLAVSLPRLDDLDLLPAWLGIDEIDPADDRVPWDAVAARASARPVAETAAAAQELGLAVSVVADGERLRAGDEQLVARGTVDPARTHLRTEAGPKVGGRTVEGLTVVDLSSLWAGPTCARLLTGAGARVVKVESTTRPDGARRGNREFYGRLHEGQQERSVAFETPEGRAELRALLAEADVVIEGSRPRALDRLGIDPGVVVAGRPGAVWISITAFGRTGPWRDRVGFGDDCAAAGGLVTWTADHSPEFVADAVADPLTGMVGAALVAVAVRDGGGVVLDVALREVARAAAMGAEPVWGSGPDRGRVGP
jgi:hypothetical protein